MDFLIHLRDDLAQIKTSNQTVADEFVNELSRKIEPFIAELLATNMDEMLNLLYRLDISEEKVKEILFGNHGQKPSELLSQAIVQREIVKRIFRLKYSSK